MDTLTHGLTGALAGRALAGGRASAVSPRAAGWAGFAAAIFPDIDFVLTWMGQLVYLELHQGLTHSLPMIPVWAWLLAVLFARVHGRGAYATDFLPFTLAGLALHTAADLCNIWGLLLWWPFSDARTAFEVVFVIDPAYTVLVIAGLAASLLWRARAGAVLGLVAVAAYSLFAFAVGAHADRTVMALPQAAGADSLRQFAAPPTLAHRRIVIRRDGHWEYAFVNLVSESARSPGTSWWTRFEAAFRPVADAEWRTAQHPEAAGDLVRTAWQQPGLAQFRAFVELPYVHRVDNEGDTVCAWFADLRFTLPETTQPFVWGACRARDGEWTIHQRGRW